MSMQQRQLLQKRSSQAAAPMEGKRRRSSGDTLEDPLWAKAWESVLRKKAILKGLDQVFLLAQANDNFALFGNDILQCFYDVATVSGEPVRGRCLKYVEQLAHRWKHGVMLRGWKVGRKPTPDEVVQCNIGMYCMERLGIHHDLKPEVEAFLQQDPPPFSAVDYLGWNPVSGPPPLFGHRDENGPISVYRALSNSLIYTFYAERVGLSLGCSYFDVFQHVHAFRPWGGPTDMPRQHYVDQCYLVTHVVFTLTNWGELALDPALTPHEYCFARAHLARQIEARDVHLLGEFVEVLRCFGVSDEDPLLRAGLAFLLASQDEDGTWDTGKDAYTVYHATMVGIQALLCHSYRGYGPGITSVSALMAQWANADGNLGSAAVGIYSRAGRGWTPQDASEQAAACLECAAAQLGFDSKAFQEAGQEVEALYGNQWFEASVAGVLPKGKGLRIRFHVDDTTTVIPAEGAFIMLRKPGSSSSSAVEGEDSGGNDKVDEMEDEFEGDDNSSSSSGGAKAAAVEAGKAPGATAAGAEAAEDDEEEEKQGDNDDHSGGAAQGNTMEDDKNDEDNATPTSQPSADVAPLAPVESDPRVDLISSVSKAFALGHYVGARVKAPLPPPSSSNPTSGPAAATNAASAPAVAGVSAKVAPKSEAPAPSTSSSSTAAPKSAVPTTSAPSSTSKAAAGAAPTSTSTSAAAGAAAAADGGAVDAEITKAQNVIAGIGKALDSNNGPALASYLKSAAGLDVSLRLLKATGIGKVVKKASKAATAQGLKESAAQADAIVTRWRNMFSA